MKNIEILKVELNTITQSIKDYTSTPTIKVICDALEEQLLEDTITYDFLVYSVNEIATWYGINIGSIEHDDYVYDKDPHHRSHQSIMKIRDDLKNHSEEYKQLLSTSEVKQKNPTISEKDIFIVHGHDAGLKNEVARFLEQMGLNPIILHEQTSGGLTIIEKIEKYSNVGFGIVLYTPDDVGRLNSQSANIQPRARQNVIFEHGYLIGKIGRNNVVALVKDEVETPNDISGVVYVNYSQNGAWKFAISKELREVGYPIDLNRL